MRKQRDFRQINRDNCRAILLARRCDDWHITGDLLDTMVLFDRTSIEEVLAWLAAEGILESASTSERLEELGSVTVEQTEFGVAFFKKPLDCIWESNSLFYNLITGASRFNEQRNDRKNYGPAQVK